MVFGFLWPPPQAGLCTLETDLLRKTGYLPRHLDGEVTGAGSAKPVATVADADLPPVARRRRGVRRRDIHAGRGRGLAHGLARCRPHVRGADPDGLDASVLPPRPAR